MFSISRFLLNIVMQNSYTLIQNCLYSNMSCVILIHYFTSFMLSIYFALCSPYSLFFFICVHVCPREPLKMHRCISSIQHCKLHQRPFFPMGFLLKMEVKGPCIYDNKSHVINDHYFLVINDDHFYITS